MQGTNPAFMNGDEQFRSSMVQRGRQTLEQERFVRSQIAGRGWFAANESDRREIEEAGGSFDRAASSVLELLAAGKLDEANREREKTLRPQYERYLAATRQVTEHAHSDSLRTSNQLTVRTGSLTRLLLGLGSWPVIMFGLFLSLFALFLVTMLLNVMLRGEQSS